MLIHKKFPEIKFIFLKSFLYFLFTSSIWALLPFIVIVHNKMSDANLGLIVGMAGLGAVLNAVSIYYLRKKLTDSQLTTFTFLLASLVIYSIGQSSHFSAFAVNMLLFGYSWSVAISVFNGIFQSEFPVEVRSRIIGIYCVCFAGSQALGGYLSGLLVHTFGLSDALTGVSISVMIVFVGYLLMPMLSGDALVKQYEQ